MKSITYPSITILMFVFMMVSVAFAQEDPAVDTTEAVPTDTTATTETSAVSDTPVETSDQQMQADQDPTQEGQPALTEREQERIINLIANLSNRMDATAARMQNIIIRLESRIDKLNAAGLDTTQASLTLTDAQESVNTAQESLIEMDELAISLISTEDPRAAWTELKNVASNIRFQLGITYAQLNGVVQALKDTARNTETQREAAMMQAPDTNPEPGEDAITSDAEMTAQ